MLGGVGLLYVGRPVRYFILLGCVIIILIASFHGLWGIVANVWFYLAFVAGILLIGLYFLVDAIRLAVQQPDYELQWYNRWWIYAGCIVIPGLLAELGGERWYKEHTAVRSFSAPSGSMIPALQVGDHFLVNVALYRERDPEPGDIAVFRLSADPSIDYVKRVVAGPGDRIQIRDGVLTLNGTEVPRTQVGDFSGSGYPSAPQYLERIGSGVEYHTLALNPNGAGNNTQEYLVPDGHYFVLGD
ncbi:MAG: signal peptidase I, partial [Hyphomicrobiales bacterium]|nr:signal peptidase I [Hyphomicrobiales bacterium]